MITKVFTLICQSTKSILCLGLLSGLAAVVALHAQTNSAVSACDHGQTSPAKLVQAVREATQQYVDVNAASAAGYAPFLGCFSGPDEGAMGIHYVNSDLVGGGEIDAKHPQGLIYEPSGDGRRLVGVEYIALAAPWLAKNSTPPILEGQSFQFIDTPNRYGLPALFELHVWAWRDNPHGAFVDWNTHVTCEKE